MVKKYSHADELLELAVANNDNLIDSGWLKLTSVSEIRRLSAGFYAGGAGINAIPVKAGGIRSF